MHTTGAALSGAPGLPPFGGGASASSTSNNNNNNNNNNNLDPGAAWRGGMAPGLFGAPGQGQVPAPAPVAAGVLQDALSYLERVQREFAGRQDVYLAFLSVMRDFKAGK
jgi:hypothetical protein